MGRMKERWMSCEMVEQLLDAITEDYRLHGYREMYGEIIDVYDALVDLEPMAEILGMPIVERCDILKEILVGGA